MTIELKPCPICGKSPKLSVTLDMKLLDSERGVLSSASRFCVSHI